METSNFRPELHVAQQSRRDKLRVQNHSNPSTQYVEVYANQLDQFPSNQEGGVIPDDVQLRSFRCGNLSYEPTMFSSNMLSFGSNSQPLLAQCNKDVTMLHQDSKQRIAGHEEAPFTSLSNAFPSNVSSSSKVIGDPQNCSTWKSIGSQESCDWISNYTSGSAGGIDSNHSPIFVGGGLSGSLKANTNNNPSTSTLYLNKPSSSYGYHNEVHSSLTSQPIEMYSRNSPKHYGGDVHSNFHSLYHNANNFQEVSSATIVTRDLGVATIAQQHSRELTGVSWQNDGNELVLLPAYADHSNPLRLKNGLDECHRWSGELDRDHRNSPNTQALSLSLSSVPKSKSHTDQAGERIMSIDLHSRMKGLKGDYLCFDAKSSYNGKVLESVQQDHMVGNPTFAPRGAGPLGPFTGYATILKSSKFLKPAQQLLDEFCNVVGPKCLKMLEPTENISGEFRASGDDVNANESIVGAMAGDSGGSSSTFYSCNDMTQDPESSSNPNEPYRPEYLQKKAKLLYLLEEVCKKYKHYHQQMQMVVSSFESVAGLSAATPYISKALKTVSRHFRFLKNAISDQLKNVRKALGEDLSSLTTGTSSSKGDTSVSRLKLIDQTFQKQRVGGEMVYFEPQQHVWKPQRGLPERAVAILRAWLFDHFLHPYPTDADKHMLANQTGLSRNQVSNWFINARVRVWKPMVEEIHMLETKGMAETGASAGKTNGKTINENVSPSYDNHTLNRLNTGRLPEKQVECLDIGSSAFMGNRMNADTWNQKRTRVECHFPGSVDGSLVDFVPCQQSGIEMGGGLGAVSLTLGLRQNADGMQPQHPVQQQHENQLRRHFGDQIIYDFVG